MTQTVNCIVLVFVGLFILAIVIGNVAILVSNFNASSTNYQRNLEGVFATMKKTQLPPELQERIHQLFTYSWLFATSLCVCTCQTAVLHQREISDELFMINRGTCELTHPPVDPHGSLQWDQLFSARHSSGLLQRTRLTNSTAGESAQVPPKPTQVSAQVDRDCILKPEILHPGEVFGEMRLLLNYQQQSNVRAVTHVEMYVLSRQVFQTFLLRFQHDRSIVLAAILEHVIGTEGLSFSMEDVYGISIVKPSSAGPTSKQEAQPAATQSGDNAQRTSMMSMTPDQAADFLMLKTNCQVCDTSIKFGFQQVDSAQDDEGAPSKETKPLSKAASSDGLLPTFVGQTPPPAAAADEPAP